MKNKTMGISQPEKVDSSLVMPEESLLYQLRQCGRMLRHGTEGKASRRRILAILDAHGSIAQRELKDILRIQAGSLSEILGKIEAEGYIQRVKSTQDKRSVSLSLTDVGQMMLDKLNKVHDEEMSTLFSILSGEEINGLITSLSKLTSDWEKRNFESEKEEKRPIGRPRKNYQEESDV